MDRIYLATKNPGKLREIRAILAPVEILEPPGEWIAPEETGSTYLENATLKAASLCTFTTEAALADDSGIEVDALDGAPGVRSARFAGEDATDEQNLRKLVESIESSARRSARYRCVAVLIDASGKVTSTQGTIEGELITQPRGSGGFGYDPIFVPLGQTRTMAELSAEEKDAISHRGKAFRKLAATLR